MYTPENKSPSKVTFDSGKMPSNSTSAATLQESSPAPAPRSRTPQILVLADDLTGACDSASAFLASGHTARVWLSAESHPEAEQTVWVRHTASRDLPPAAAAQAVTSAAKLLPASPETLLFKKVDSAGRGNIAAELIAAREAYAADLILLAPAFPATGRIVRCGILQIKDIAGQRTTLSLAALFPEDQHQHIGTAHTPAELLQLVAHQKKIILCDAETDADLRAIAQTASTLPARILWAGSAGLANALAAFHASKQPAPPQSSETQPGAILVIAGTSHNVTQLQLAHLLNTPRTVLLSPDAFDGLQLDRDSCAVLLITGTEQDAIDIRRLWQQLSPKPSALVLTGGDTAAHVLRALEAEAIILKGDVSPGVPWGTLEGGLADQCAVVTKSGGFGDEDCLTKSVAFLRERQA